MAGIEPRKASLAGKAAWPLLVLAAALQILLGLSSLAYVFMGIAKPSSGLGGWTIAASGGLQAIAAAAVFALAARRDLRGATLVMAGCILLEWLSTLPTVVQQGLAFSGGARLASAYFLFSPLLAAAAAALAWRNPHPVLAALVVTAPTSAGLLFVLAFGVVIAVHGF